MSFIYEVIQMDEGITAIKRTDENGAIAWVPQDLGNSDYQRYLNPMEHLTEIPTKGAYLATPASESAPTV